MYLSDEIFSLKKSIIKNFQKGLLTEEDKKHVYVKTQACKHGLNPWKHPCYYIGDEYVYFSGENRGYLNKASIYLADCHKKHTIKCEVLILKLESPIAKAFRLDYSGFYHYNPSRLYPDSFIALRFLELIDPLPKDKGYKIVNSFS